MPSSTYRHCEKMELWNAAEIGWNFSTLSTLVNALQPKCIFKPGSWWLMLSWWELADSPVPLRSRCVLLLMAEYLRNGSLLVLRMPLIQDRDFILQLAHSDMRDWCFAGAGNGGCELQAPLLRHTHTVWMLLLRPSISAVPALSPQVALAKPCVPLSWASPVSPSLAWLCPMCPAAGSQLSCWGCLALTRMPSCRQWGQPCPNPGTRSSSKHLVLCNGRAAFGEGKAGKGALCREF